MKVLVSPKLSNVSNGSHSRVFGDSGGTVLSDYEAHSQTWANRPAGQRQHTVFLSSTGTHSHVSAFVLLRLLLHFVHSQAE